MLQQIAYPAWLSSFVVSGFYNQQKESSVWQTQNLITNLSAIPIVMVCGRLADRVSAKKFVPACIIF
jgi:hypothetical protein